MSDGSPSALVDICESVRELSFDVGDISFRGKVRLSAQVSWASGFGLPPGNVRRIVTIQKSIINFRN
jgi:hypothetical protein